MIILHSLSQLPFTKFHCLIGRRVWETGTGTPGLVGLGCRRSIRQDSGEREQSRERRDSSAVPVVVTRFSQELRVSERICLENSTLTVRGSELWVWQSNMWKHQTEGRVFCWWLTYLRGADIWAASSRPHKTLFPILSPRRNLSKPIAVQYKEKEDRYVDTYRVGFVFPYVW